jgi:hypothetical protein
MLDETRETARCAEQRGRELERAAVVEWLRTCHQTVALTTEGAERSAAADEIASGEHVGAKQ